MSMFVRIGKEGHLSAIRAATDELYWYHQFLGAMTVVIPISLASVHSCLEGRVRLDLPVAKPGSCPLTLVRRRHMYVLVARRNR